MEQVITTFNNNLSAIVDKLTDRIINDDLALYNTMPREQLKQLVATVVGAFKEDLADKERSEFPAYWEKVGGVRAAQGHDIGTLLRLNTLGTETMTEVMWTALVDDAEARAWWSYRLQTIMESGILTLSKVFIAAHEEIISNQAAQIRALSTPIIPMYNGILVLPLVGTIDSHRASHVMETLLEGIGREQAEVVIVDVTGVPIVDTGTANYLLQAARAAHLLGAQVVLVGISAEIAQTIVQLGVELAGLVTRANLQDGIEYALRQQGQAIQPIRA